MEMVKNPEIKAVITARGGEFLLEILPFLDFQQIKQNPKWIQGYSDTTGLNFCITTICDIATIYGENFSSFAMKPWHICLKQSLDMLEGKEIVQKSFKQYQEGWQEEVTGTEPYVLTKKVEWENVTGEAEIYLKGRLLGGCLDVLVCLAGTKWDKVKEFCKTYQEDGIVWFFDNCELTSEGVLRGLWQLKEAGWFANATGFIFGRSMTRKSNTGMELKEAILEVLQELNVPIILEADIGHVPPQMTLMNGAIVNIKSKGKEGEVIFERK